MGALHAILEMVDWLFKLSNTSKNSSNEKYQNTKLGIWNLGNLHVSCLKKITVEFPKLLIMITTTIYNHVFT